VNVAKPFSPEGEAMIVRRFVIVFLSLCIARSASAQDGPYPPDDATVLLAHLDGDGSAANPGGPPMNVRGEVAYTTGRFGKALALKRDGSVLFIYRAPALMPRHRSWTIECWIKPTGQPTARMAVLGVFGNMGRRISIQLDGRRLVGLVAADENHRVHAASGNLGDALFDGHWHHIAMVLDRGRNGELRLYLDGRQVNQEAVYQPLPFFIDDGISFTLGAGMPWTGKSGFQGLIDELRITAGVPEAFTAPADAPEPPPVFARPIYPTAAIATDAPESQTPLRFSPTGTVIVIPDVLPMSADMESARLLATWLQKAYGVETGFQRTDPSDAIQRNAELVLAVGKTPWVSDENLAEVDLHGFIIKRKGNVVVIAGGSPRATLWGTVHFLDRFAGVRFYMPGDLFTSVPAEKPTPLAGIDVTTAPFVRSASLSGLHNDYATEKLWDDRNAMNRRRGGSHQHNMFALFPPSRYAKTYPEIYPIMDGKRLIPDKTTRHWQPCFSEQKLVDLGVEAAIRHFASDPDHEYIGFGVMDTNDFCQCARCRTNWDENLVVAKTQETDARRAEMLCSRMTHGPIYWDYMNTLAARLETELPAAGITDKKLIVSIVYSAARQLPTEKLHPDILTWHVFKWSDGLIDKRLLPQPDGTFKLGRMDEWLEIGSHLGHHDWAHGKGILIPRIYTGLMSESFKLFKPHDLIYTHTEGYPNWGLDGPKLYIHGKIHWDPDVDVKRIWRQFADDMFGPAADPMHEYFATLEQLWISLNNDVERKLNRWATQFSTKPTQQQTIHDCRALLDKASGLAETDEQKRRIQLFSKTFKLSENLFGLAAKSNVTQAEVDEVLKYAKTVIMPNPMTVYRQSNPQDSYDRIESAVWTLAGVRGLKKPT
jgi:hypothetical protein